MSSKASDDSFRLFADPKNWDYYISHCEAIDDLTALEKEKAKRAFLFLKAEFGPDFLDFACSTAHPLFMTFINLAPWTRRWLTWFAVAIKKFQGLSNYPKFIERLKDPTRYYEAMSVLDVAYKLSVAGFEIEIDPRIEISGKIKMPDIKATSPSTDEHLFIEISQLGESRSRQEAQNTTDAVFRPLVTTIPFAAFSGRLHKALSQRHLDEVIKQVERLVERFRRENSFQELSIKGVIELGITSYEERPILEAWAAERKLLVGGLNGPPHYDNEIHRMQDRIERKQRQVPPDVPNILVIWNNSLMSAVDDPREVVGLLEEEVFKYPRLAAVVIRGGWSGDGESDSKVMVGHHVLSKRTGFDFLHERTLFLLNDFCDHKITIRSLSMLYDGFLSH
jgi:hypothetical protein